MNPNLIIFAVAVLIIWWSWSLWGERLWKPALPRRVKRWQIKVTDYLPSRRKPVIADARAWVIEVKRKIDKLLDWEERNAGTEADADAQREIADDAAGMAPFSMVIAPIDIFAQWLLCVATLPQFSSIENLAFGVGIGSGIYVATFYFFTLWDRRSTPRRSVRVARVWAMMSFAIAAIGAVIYLAARYAAPAFFVGREGVVLASLVALAELLPVAGAAASFGASVAHRAAVTAETTAKLNEQKAMIEAFETWLDENDPDTPQEPSSESTAPRLVEEASNA